MPDLLRQRAVDVDSRAPAHRAPGTRAHRRRPARAADRARACRPAHRPRSLSGPDDADVDRCGLSEIQHLIDDVGRLEEEAASPESAAGSSRRSRAMSSAVGVCFCLSEIRISPSIGPTVAESLRAMLMPLYGRPILSRMVVDLFVADDLADRGSRPAQSPAASSPVACLAARARAGASGRRRPAGKSPVRDRKQQQRTRRSAARRITTVRSGSSASRQAHCGSLRGSARSRGSNARCTRMKGLRAALGGCCPGSPLPPRLRRPCTRRASASGTLNSTGTSVKDSTRLASSDTQTDSDSGENRYLAVPCSRNTGTNTMQMHSVASKVGIADFAGAVDDGLLKRLAAARRAARCFRSPPCRCRPGCRPPGQSRRASWY